MCSTSLAWAKKIYSAHNDGARAYHADDSRRFRTGPVAVAAMPGIVNCSYQFLGTALQLFPTRLAQLCRSSRSFLDFSETFPLLGVSQQNIFSKTFNKKCFKRHFYFVSFILIFFEFFFLENSKAVRTQFTARLNNINVRLFLNHFV